MDDLRAYAEQRGLSLQQGAQLSRATPSLEYLGPSEAALSGVLRGGAEGTLARHTFEGDDRSAAQTVVVVAVGESIAFLPKLYCRDAAWKRTRTYALGAEGFRSGYRNVEFESVAVNRRYALQVETDQDDLWLRELFSPVFLDWLAERAPLEFSFEVVEGTLCGVMPKRLSEPAELDLLCELTSYVAERIRAESLEDEQRGASFDQPLPPPEQTEDRRKADAAVAKVKWPQPPADMASAQRAYAEIARDQPGGWMPALKVGGGIGLLLAVVGVPIAFLAGAAFVDFGDLGTITGAVAALAVAGLAFGVGAFLFVLARRSQTQRRARAYGQRAFVHEYARSRGLEPEDENAFQARFMRLQLPGPARHVLRGTLPGCNLFGRLLLCTDPTGASGGYVVAVTSAPEARTGAEAELRHASLAVPAATGPRIEDLDAVCDSLRDG